MPEYLLATRELLVGLHEDIETAASSAPDLTSPQGARRNLLRIIANGQVCEHALPAPDVPTVNETMAARLAQAERLIRRCEPLIVEVNGGGGRCGRHMTTDSVAYAIDQFLRKPLGEVR